MTDHTYLRYECADSFGLVTSAGAATNSRAPVCDQTLQVVAGPTANSPLSLVTTTGSHCSFWNVKTGQLTHKLGHAEFTGVGTGKALNGSQVLCLDVSNDGYVVATGWLDGAVRVFEMPSSQASLSFSLLHDEDDGTSPERPDPLTLNGHSPSPVSALCLQGTTRLASGGSDGTILVWDLVAESGLFRLLGHQGGITQLHFLKTGDNTLASTSLDGLIKIWDLQAQCCVQTMANMRGEIWASSYLSLPEEGDQYRQRLLVGSLDGQVRMWNVQASQRDAQVDDSKSPMEDTNAIADDVCHDMGLLEAPLQHLATSSSKADTSAVLSKERVLSIRSSPYSRHVGVLQANAKVIHVYSIRSVKETSRKKQRRLKRRLEKQGKKANSGDDGENKSSKKRGVLDEDDSDQEEVDNQQTNKAATDPASYDPDRIQASDEFEYLGAIKASHKIKSFVFLPTKEEHFSIKKKSTKKTLVKIACALSTNTLEMYSLEKEKDADNMARPLSEKLSNLTPLSGHPTGVRAIALSSNDDTAVTISKGTCKLWNIANRTCLQSVTLEEPILPSQKPQSKHSNHTYQGLCAAFLPGNTHVIVGTKEGHLLIIDTAASEIVYWEEKAHDDAIWSIDIAKTNSMTATVNIVTGAADKMVKFWTLERQGDDSDDEEDELLSPGAPRVVPTRVLEMTDEVVAVKYSHSNFANAKKRMVFVSTLDCTIKVFFDDSLKLFLSLYGHKLPALAVDASDDDTLLVSGSADKTIKLHGLDWGDTHKTLHGHSDSVTDVQFVRGTHNFFSASKDGTVRYWDGDRFEQILVLRGHQAEVNCLAISARDNGAVCLSGSMDRQVRVWERTRDIVFLEEERERELEKMFDEDPSKNRREEQGTANILDRKGRSDAEGDDEEMKQDEPQSEEAVKQSILSINAGDRLLEALELADQELQAARSKNKKGAVRTANPMLLGMEPPQYVLWVLKSIKSADLEQALLVLPLGHAERLLYYLVLLLKEGPRSVELCCRAAVFTFKSHQNQMLLNSNNNQAMAPLLRELRRLLQLRLQESRDTIGYNLAACRMIGRIAQEHKESKMIGISPEAANVWAGLGLGSDVAAALEGSSKRRR